MNQLQGNTLPTDDVSRDINNYNVPISNDISVTNINNNSSTYKNKYNDKLILNDDSENSLPASLHIATHNIRGTLGHLSTQVATTSYMLPMDNQKSRIDILGLAHTRLTTKQSKHAFTYSQFSDFKPYFATSNDPSYQFSGVGFLIRSDFAKYVKQFGH